MSVRQFRLMVAGEVAESQVDVLFDRAGDACVEVQPEVSGWVAFDREAPTLVDAIVSGVRDLDVAGLVASSAGADDPIVSLETIAERVGRPAEVVRAWELPAPVWPHPRRPVYAWPEVSAWLRRHHLYAPPDEAVTLHAVTLTLQLRALAPRLERMTPIRSLLHL